MPDGLSSGCKSVSRWLILASWLAFLEVLDGFVLNGRPLPLARSTLLPIIRTEVCSFSSTFPPGWKSKHGHRSGDSSVATHVVPVSFRGGMTPLSLQTLCRSGFGMPGLRMPKESALQQERQDSFWAPKFGHLDGAHQSRTSMRMIASAGMSDSQLLGALSESAGTPEAIEVLQAKLAKAGAVDSETIQRCFKFPLDKFQIDAIDALLRKESVIVSAPTGRFYHSFSQTLPRYLT